MAIDPATRASLELEKSQQGGRDGSLLAAIDRTVTSSGARLLSARLARPLLDPAAIEGRLDAVAWFVERKANRYAVAFGRRKIDACKAMARPVDLTFGFAELGLPKGAAVAVVNPLAAAS